MQEQEETIDQTLIKVDRTRLEEKTSALLTELT